MRLILAALLFAGTVSADQVVLDDGTVFYVPLGHRAVILPNYITECSTSQPIEILEPEPTPPIQCPGGGEWIPGKGCREPIPDTCVWSGVRGKGCRTLTN